MMHAKLAAQQAISSIAAPRYGLIQGYAPAQYRVKVTLAPSVDGKNPQTGYMPLCSPWVGPGWGIVCPPGPRDQHAIVFAQHHPDQGIAVGRLFDNNHLPPRRLDGGVAVYGELLIVHQSGTRIELTNDGKLTIVAQNGLVIQAPTVAIGGVGGGNCAVSIAGTVTATGEGTFNGGHTVSQHDHPGVATGSGTTGLPQG